MRRGATITAKTAVRALVLDRPAFTAMVGQHRLDLKYGKRRAIGGLQNIVIPAASPAPAAAAKVEQDSKKSSRTRDLLRRAVLKNVLFQHLDANQNDAIVDAMCRVDLTAGETVIRQFEAGDYFYAVETGRLDVFVQKCNGAPQVNVNDPKGPGDCFGELALLYNAPRNATVVAVEDSVLWAIERVKFRAIIDRLSAQRVADIEKLLYKVPLLQKLTQAERVTLIGAIEVRAFQPGAIIVAQGSHNDSLQMVLSGEAVATQMMQGRSTELVRLRTGDFFGDRVRRVITRMRICLCNSLAAVPCFLN
jgi:CRP-like cAMP-binding protein